MYSVCGTSYNSFGSVVRQQWGHGHALVLPQGAPGCLQSYAQPLEGCVPCGVTRSFSSSDYLALRSTCPAASSVVACIQALAFFKLVQTSFSLILTGSNPVQVTEAAIRGLRPALQPWCAVVIINNKLYNLHALRSALACRRGYIRRITGRHM